MNWVDVGSIFSAQTLNLDGCDKANAQGVRLIQVKADRDASPLEREAI